MEQPSSENSAEQILNALKKTSLFSDFTNETLNKLSLNATWVILKKGETLFNKGDLADSMYLLTEGKLIVIIESEGAGDVLRNIEAGQTIGEMQFLVHGKRTADIFAGDNSKIIRFSNIPPDFTKEEKGLLVEKLNQIIRQRLEYKQLAAILPKLFGELTPRQIEKISTKADWVQLHDEEVLFKQGDPGDSFSILASGRLSAALENGDGTRRVIKQISRGQIIGEMALLGGENRTATVYATHESQVFRFKKEAFSTLLKEYPDLLMQITRSLVQRLSDSNKGVSKWESNPIIALVPVHESSPLKEFGARFLKAISSICPVLYLDGPAMDEMLDTPGISQVDEKDPNNIRLQEWISIQESKYEFIILETDTTPTNWTTWCLGHADQVLLVADQDEDSQLGEIENFLEDNSNKIVVEKRSIAILHPNGEKLPTNTKRWQTERNLEFCYHIRNDSEKDIERIARIISGTAVGLALSGGGARGFAHIGVIKALEESNIAIDIIGGTSMGAYIGAMYAKGWTCEELASYDISKLIFDMTLPVTSLFAGKKISNGFKSICGEVAVEDLWIPYFCVSSNLTNAEMKVHRTGILWKSLQASNAAPGIYPPVVMDGDLHVDGALLNNLPVDIMGEICQGNVLGVDVSPAVDMKENPNYGDHISGWKILWRKINPFVKPIIIPSIQHILHRAGELASIANQRNMLAQTTDLYLRPPVEKYELGDYALSEKIIEDGYQYAMSKIKEWNLSDNLDKNLKANLKKQT
ncbi:MAG: cyclic nucleotide-binding and patatin-like phospholipase domain-containing protein [Leptospirales bacterium]